MFRHGAVARSVLAILIFGTACGGGSDSGTPSGPTGGGAGGLTLAISPSDLSVPQGGTGTETVTLTRTGSFAGAVAITVEGLPTNVNAAAAPASVGETATSSTITITAATAAAPGASTITIRGKGTGISDATVTFTLTVTAVTPPGLALALSPAALSVQQGGQGASTATLTRTGGFTGSVAFTAVGAPAGMTITFTPANTTGNTSAIAVAVAGTVAANTYQISIHASATGLADQTATLSVTVTAAAGVTTTFHFCAGAPIFAAFQDGNGPWTAVPITNNTITFPLASGRGGVAYVLSFAANQFSTVIFYGTQAELSGIVCPVPGNKTVLGSVANVGPTEVAYVSMGNALSRSATNVIPASGTSFTLSNVVDVPTDLIASRAVQVIGAGGFSQTGNRAIIRRGVDPANNSTLPVLDFNASEAVALVTRNLTLNGLGTDVGSVQVAYSTNLTTSAPSTVPFYSEAPGVASANRQYPAFPTPQANDLHIITVAASPAGTPPATTRGVLAYLRDAVDRSLTLGPVIGPVTITTAATATNALLRAQYTLQPEYNRTYSVTYVQQGSPISRSVTLSMTAGYLNGASTFDATLPDLSPVSGWNLAWGLSAGVTTPWTMFTNGWTGSGATVDGFIVLSAIRRGTTTP